MKYIILFVSLVISYISIHATTTAQLSTIDNTSPSITQDLNSAIDTKSLTNPIRQGSRIGVESPDKSSMINTITVTEILGFEQAQNQTIGLIKNIVNILLGFVSFVVFIFLIYEGYMIVAAGTDEKQYEKAVTRLKNGAIAIGGIALSWTIVSFIFAALDLITSP